MFYLSNLQIYHMYMAFGWYDRSVFWIKPLKISDDEDGFDSLGSVLRPERHVYKLATVEVRAKTLLYDLVGMAFRW